MKIEDKTILEAKTLRKEMAKLYHEILYFSWTSCQLSTDKYCSKYLIGAKKWRLSDQNLSTIFWSDYRKLEKNYVKEKLQKIAKNSPINQYFANYSLHRKVMCTFDTMNISMIIRENLLCPSVKMMCVHYLAKTWSN